MTSGRRIDPEIFRRFFLADIINVNLKSMVRAVFRLRQPLFFSDAVSNRGKNALDRVGRPDALLVFSWKFVEGQQLETVYTKVGCVRHNWH